MIEQKDVISFFDRCAPNWDAEMIRNEPVIRTILDNARRDRIENYESSNDAYVVEDLGCAALVENITIV